MNLDDLVGALRAAEGDDPELAAATQLRVHRSLARRARSHHQLVGVITMLAILLVGTASWALATGQIAALWTPAPEAVSPPEPPHAVAPPRRAPVREPDRSIVRPVPELPAITLAPAEPPPPVPAVVASVPLVPTRPDGEPSAPVEALYRAAHELHFHGGDPAATLAAWDAYLAAEPAGRFSVEAQYNRAITLIRLARYAEARAALSPFARGEVAGGYRQAEAEQLVERLARLP